MPRSQSSFSKPDRESECTESEANILNCSKATIKNNEIPYLWYPTLQSIKQIEYVRKLELEFGCLQKAFLAMTTHYARVQFRVRQITMAAPCERDGLLRELEKIAFECVDMESADELPRIQRDLRCMGDVRRKQNFMLEKLRNQLSALTEASELEGIEEPVIEQSSTQFETDSTESDRQTYCSSISFKRSTISSKRSSKTSYGQ